ncbi:MAG: hypothetical protein IKC89_07890, partial [Lentisphaeria bacterium]|nr:hypothetical protein [Lentisphaeria bacterium]
SRSGFLPAGLPSFPVPRRAQRLLVFSFDYSACGQPIVSSDLAAYCSAATASHHYFKTRFCSSPIFLFATNGSKKYSAFRGRGGVWGGETIFSREKRVSPPRKSDRSSDKDVFGVGF